MSVQHLITDHLDLWTGAVTHKRSAGRGSGKSGKIELTGIKKLRELILELAVRGKLVEQDPTDESACGLLERIAEEKARLIRQGKIKKSKKLPTIAEEEKPFEIPVGWAWVKLGKLGIISSSSRVHQKDWQDEGIPFYRAREIVQLAKNGSVDNDLFISDELYSSLTKTGLVPEPNDFMITGVGTIGIPYIVKEGDRFYFKDASVLILKNIASIYPLYLLDFFKSKTWNDGIHENSMGTTVHTLTIARAGNISVPFPPLAEQHRIVAKVDELMALCDRLEERNGDQLEAHEVLVDTLLDALTHSADAVEVAENWARIAEHFDSLFTTEVSIDKLKQAILHLAVNGQLIKFKTETLTLKNILSFGPKNGLSPKEINYDTGTKVLKLGATSREKLDIDESKNIDININSSSHLWIEKGDILIQRGNSSSYVGCNIVVESDQPGIIYPDLMMKIRTNGLANPKFISYSLSSMDSRRFMWRHMTGTSGTMPKISKKTVEEIPIKLPSLNIQMEIVEILENLFSFCETLKASIQKANNINIKVAESLMGRATK